MYYKLFFSSYINLLAGVFNYLFIENHWLKIKIVVAYRVPCLKKLCIIYIYIYIYISCQLIVSCFLNKNHKHLSVSLNRDCIYIYVNTN